MKLLTAFIISIIPAISVAFTTTSSVQHSRHTAVKLDATRREILSELASTIAMPGVMATGVQPAMAATVVTAPISSNVPQDNEIVKEQRTVTDKVDINNSAVADYMQLPGMYPKIGGKIANGGPYSVVKDIYKLKNLSAEEVKTIKKYENKLACTPATGLDTLRGRDPYRRSFNK